MEETEKEKAEESSEDEGLFSEKPKGKKKDRRSSMFDSDSEPELFSSASNLKNENGKGKQQIDILTTELRAANKVKLVDSEDEAERTSSTTGKTAYLIGKDNDLSAMLDGGQETEKEKEKEKGTPKIVQPSPQMPVVFDNDPLQNLDLDFDREAQKEEEKEKEKGKEKEVEKEKDDEGAMGNISEYVLSEQSGSAGTEEEEPEVVLPELGEGNRLEEDTNISNSLSIPFFLYLFCL